MDVLSAYRAAKSDPKFAPLVELINSVIEKFSLIPISAKGLTTIKFLRSTEAYRVQHQALLFEHGISDQTSGEICSETTRIVIGRLIDKFVTERSTALREVLMDEWQKLDENQRMHFVQCISEFGMMKQISIFHVPGLLLGLMKSEISLDPI